ncbi:MAG: glycosyl transferase family 3, partial [Paracoccaceae bacterium]
ANHIEARNFAYVPLRVLSPELQRLIELRPVFGLRSPVHSFSRMLNPFAAPVMIQGIFHRGFMDVHAGAAQLLGQPHMAVFRGEGGEIERRPNKPTAVWTTHGTQAPEVETWPALLADGHQASDGDMNVARLAQVWRGENEGAYAHAAIVGTLAVALRTMGKAATLQATEVLASDLWAARNRSFLAMGA